MTSLGCWVRFRFVELLTAFAAAETAIALVARSGDFVSAAYPQPKHRIPVPRTPQKGRDPIGGRLRQPEIPPLAPSLI